MVKNDLLAFSQGRWNFVYQRTQHLLSRYAKYRRIFFIEEPIFTETNQISYRKVFVENGVEVIKPVLSKDFSESQVIEAMKRVIDDLIEDEFVINFSVWMDTPKAVAYTRHLSPINLIYDCINEPEAAHQLTVQEIELLEKADLVFTASHKLHEARKNQHHNIHSFPDSIDLSHFRQARQVAEPLDQRKLSGPKIGYAGEINSNINFELLRDMADYRPSWNFILVGPVTEDCAKELPKRPNIFYFGKKDYKYLPNYFAGWDVTISPFKTGKNTQPSSQFYEFLATGRPVVATPTEELKQKYEPLGLVTTANTATCFVAACEGLMPQKNNKAWLDKVDSYLDSKSWDYMFESMKELEIKTLNSSVRFKKHRNSYENIMHV